MNWNFTRSADDRIDTVVWSVSNTQTILELTKAGFGPTVIANRLVERDLAEGALVEPPGGPGRFRRTYHLAIHKDKFVDERLKAFMAIRSICTTCRRMSKRPTQARRVLS